MKTYIALVLMLLVGCSKPKDASMRYWQVAMPPSARLIKYSEEGSRFKQADRIVSVEYQLSAGDFDRMIDRPVGVLPRPAKILDYNTGFLDYNFDTSLNPYLLISVRKEPAVLMQAIFDSNLKTLVLMRQDH